MDELTLFETPQQRSSREYNEALAAYIDAHRVADGFQCQQCGGVSRKVLARPDVRWSQLFGLDPGFTGDLTTGEYLEASRGEA